MTHPVPNDPRIQRMEQFCDTLVQMAGGATTQAVQEILLLFNSHFNHPPLDEDTIGMVYRASVQRVLPHKVHPVLEAIHRFVHEKCVKPYSFETTTVRTPTADLYQAFLRYIDDNNEDLPKVSLQAFGRALTRLGIPVKRRAGGNCRPVTIRRPSVLAMQGLR